jgi:hypothetical protein
VLVDRWTVRLSRCGNLQVQNSNQQRFVVCEHGPPCSCCGHGQLAAAQPKGAIGNGLPLATVAAAIKDCISRWQSSGQAHKLLGSPFQLGSLAVFISPYYAPSSSKPLHSKISNSLQGSTLLIQIQSPSLVVSKCSSMGNYSHRSVLY